ncbi:MAG: alpha/beta fold hydrolase [Candidatus Promineifilaceae bacterium]|nr:alpha/beta fold hydrolase [Candidatus Promineifilaceae bacterium]
MPFIDNQGVQIHYKITGEGPPLVLQHGFTDSLDSWDELGYVEMLSQEYRLIMVDARGHGASDKPRDLASYKLEHRVSDIVAILDNFQINTTHYWGYSMGGWIGFGMAKYALPRLKSLIIGGAQPYGNDFSYARNTLSKGIEAWVALARSWGISSEKALTRLRKNDAQALIAVAQDRPDMSDILPDIKIPCLFYAGSDDDQYELIERCAEELPNATLKSFADHNHISIAARSDLVVPPIMHFLASL